MNSNSVIAVGVVLAVVLSGISLARGGKDGRDGRDGVTFGAVSVLNSPLEMGTGGTIFGGGSKLSSGSRTLCNLKTPNATSTGSFEISIQNPEAYTLSVQAGYGATPGATTTLLGTVNALATLEGRNLVASTTGVFFPPNTNLVVNVAATTSVVDTALNPIGGCTFLGSSY